MTGRPCVPASACACHIFHADAVNRTGRNAELATGAVSLQNGMHQLVAAHDRIDRTCLEAQRATDAPGFVDDGHRTRRFSAVVQIERPRRQASDASKALDAFGASRRTLIDGRFATGDGMGISRAIGIRAARALRLRQGGVDATGKRIWGRGIHCLFTGMGKPVWSLRRH